MRNSSTLNASEQLLLFQIRAAGFELTDHVLKLTSRSGSGVETSAVIGPVRAGNCSLAHPHIPRCPINACDWSSRGLADPTTHRVNDVRRRREDLDDWDAATRGRWASGSRTEAGHRQAVLSDDVDRVACP